MAKKIAPLLPYTEDLLHQLGERLRLARLRRGLSAKQMGERAGMAAMTLRSLERGGSGVTMGAYLAVMQVLGIERDLQLLGQADPLGRELQDARLGSHKTAPAKHIRKAVEKTNRTERIHKTTEATIGGDQIHKTIEEASGSDLIRKAIKEASSLTQIGTSSGALAALIAATKKGH